MLQKIFTFLVDFKALGHVMWVPITTAWSIFRLQMEETASRYRG